MGFFHRAQKLVLNIFIILLAIVFTPLCLLSPLFFIPLLAWRSFIGILGHWIDPKNLKLMSARNSVVAVDDLHTHPEQTIVVSIGFSGPLDFSYCLQLSERAILGPDAQYPELRNFYESFAGYLFWREDEQFELRNHIKEYSQKENNKVTYEELKEFCLDLVKKPFPRGKSPWEVFLVNNFTQDDCNDMSVIIIRIHHGLCDGFSILELFTSVIGEWDDTKDKLPLAVWVKGAQHPTFWNYALMSILIPYNLIKQGISSYDINSFRLSQKKLTRKLLTAQIQMNIDEVKEIKNKWNVTFSAIVYSAIIGGFRNYMMAKGLRVPKSFHVGAPFPWPHRKSTGFQNNMCVAILKFPMGAKTVEQRVKLCESNWLRIKRSTVPLMNWTLMPLMGLLPNFLVKLLVQNNVTTIVLSNFPGPAQRLQVQNVTTEGVEFVTGLWRGNCGIGIGLISCNGLLKINIGLDEALVSTQDQVEEIKNFIQNEFNILRTHVHPSTA